MKKLIKLILPKSAVIRMQKLSVKYPRLSGITTEKIFTNSHVTNGLKNMESASGPGSAMSATENIRQALPKLFTSHQIKNIIDIPCGDFHWMRHVDLSDIDYKGFDIVQPLIAQNVKRYQNKGRSFEQKDLLTDSLEKADLVLNRECLVHLSLKEIAKALMNIKKSGSTYLFTTTYPDWSTNEDIITGDWRPLNLQKEPFNLPSPELLIKENYSTEKINKYSRKCLGLWKVKNIPNIPVI